MRAAIALVLLVACGNDSNPTPDAVADIHAWTNCHWNSGSQTCEIGNEPACEAVACTARADQHGPGLSE